MKILVLVAIFCPDSVRIEKEMLVVRGKGGQRKIRIYRIQKLDGVAPFVTDPPRVKNQLNITITCEPCMPFNI